MTSTATRPRVTSSPSTPPERQWLARVAQFLVGRRSAWAALAVGITVLAAIAAIWAGATAPPRGQAVPPDSESARVAAVVQQSSDVQPLLLVAHRTDGGQLQPSDIQALRAAGQSVTSALGSAAPRPASQPRIAEDGAAAMLAIPVVAHGDGTAQLPLVTTARDAVASHGRSGVEMQVTGGPAFAADIAGAFSDADIRLLLVTIAIVAILLGVTYRSPVLMWVPLAVVALADQVAGRVTAALAQATGMSFDAGIVSVLVFGAGTNYALLLISRYREELRRESNHRVALARAWQLSVPAILASNITVVLALLTLLAASIPGTRGLGLMGAAGLLIGLAAALVVLPPALAVGGRRLFWPVIPRPDGATVGRPAAFERLARAVTARPLAVLAGATAALALAASGLVGASVGLSQTQAFRVQSESAAGLETVAAHFPAGEVDPLQVLTKPNATDQVVEAARSVPGVVAVRPTQPGAWQQVQVVPASEPGSAESMQTVRDLRAAVHDIPGAEAMVGGRPAQDLDARQANRQDLLVVVPLVLLVNVIVLVILLRAVVAPLVLQLVTVASSVAAMGLGAFLARTVLGMPALDSQTPLLAFLFLVALGIDYTIFLVHRARQEARTAPTREAIVQAVGHTGAVITSAGLVVAGVFAALGVLPLVVLGQLGMIVGIGVLVDTFIVRTIVVPAAFAALGDRMWWPARPRHNGDRQRGHAATTV